MSSLVLTLAQTDSRVAFDVETLVVVGLVLAAVFLVFWASRPSVIARYSARKEDGAGDAAESPKDEPRA